MRLKPNEIRAIKDAVQKNFSAESDVYLFGSRTDDTQRGGDIDLLVETDKTGEHLQEAKLRTMVSIQLALGDQKIDIVTKQTGKKADSLILIEAERTGIQL